VRSGIEAFEETGPGGRAGRSGWLVLGIGNALRGDDALGWHATARLRADARLAGARITWVHQLTPELARDLAEASRVVFVDARTGLEPGELRVERLGRARGGGGILSHHVAPEGLLTLAAELFEAAPDAWAVGVGVEGCGLGDPLSATVEAALPRVVDAVVAILQGCPDA
jgi:hydrogenase maturation protease